MQARTLTESRARGESPVGGGSRIGSGGAVGWIRRSPYLASLVVCVLLALLSAAVLPTVPSYDPWSWIVWGREVSDPHLSFVVNGGPSWKPLTVIFTTLFGLFGGAAPTLWVITERAGALMAFPAAYRLAVLLATRIGHRRAGPVAGVIAALALILTQDWAYYFYRGASEPILVGCALWAVERLFAGKRWQAFMLGIALGLMRPEAWPLMIVFAAWLAYAERTPWVYVGLALGLLSMPFFWFVPPGISTGQPFLAANHAADYNGQLGSSPFVTVMRRGVDDQSVPVLALAVIALLITLFLERDRLILAVTALAAVWWVVVVGETLDGYPGLERFFLPAAALTCVMAGVGVVRIGALVGQIVGRVGPRALIRPAAIVAAILAVALAYGFVDGRVTYSREQYSLTKQAVTRFNGLTRAVAAVGGHDGVFPCKSSFAAINHSAQTAAAWKLHVTLGRVGTRMSHAGVLFVGPHDTIDGGAALINPYLDRHVLIRQVGVWRIYRVYRAGHLNHCVGGA